MGYTFCSRLDVLFQTSFRRCQLDIGQQLSIYGKGTKLVLALADIQLVKHSLLQDHGSQRAEQRLRSRKGIGAEARLLASEVRHTIEAKEKKETEDKARRVGKAI